MKKINLLFKLIILLVLAANLFSESYAVGALFSRPRFSNEEYQKMWIKSITSTVDIRGQIAVTHIDQVFHNELNTSVETIYIFPLPENAVMTELIYWVNGVRYVASIRERQQAVNNYNSKLRQWLDPALLEYLGDNLFRLSIVPVDANSDVRTEITYVEPLKYDLGTVAYTFKLNTLELSSKPLETVSINLDAKSQTPFKEFYSPSHQNSTATKITKISDSHYTLVFGDENFYPDKDLTVKFETYRDNVNFQILTYKPSAGDSIGTDNFYAIWITPPDSIAGEEIIPKDIVFTADVSSSMEGTRLQQMKEALNDFLDLLNPNDKFNIITFGTFVDKYKPDLVPASSNNIEDAKNYVNQLYALGLTNINEAITSSLTESFEDTTSNNLIFLTDGYPTWGVTNIDTIVSNSTYNNKKNVRIFSFGIGDDISKTLLLSLSNANHGYAQFITSDDSISLVVNNHFKRISKPVMTDIKIDMGGLDSWDQYPKVLNDLFWGSQVTQLGLYNKSGTFTVTLSGNIRAKQVKFTKTINFADTTGGDRFVPRLWAKSKIDDILNLIAIYGETEELVNQVIELSLRFQILTPYTAFYSDPDNPDNPSAVTEDRTKLPDRFLLKQNYPNPFNPETIIEYSLPVNESSYHVVIKIYNSLGQLVAVIVDKDQSSGIYKVTWNGKDSGGNLVASGIYFYSIQAGSFTQIKKMVLLR